MIQITPQHRLLLAVEPVDFRAGIDSLCAICKQKLIEDPFSGSVFVFTNRKRTAVKILVYDGTGYWLCLKRFSKGTLAFWPKKEGIIASMSAPHLHVLLAGGNPNEAYVPKDWRRVTPSTYAAALI
jgi:transposase